MKIVVRINYSDGSTYCESEPSGHGRIRRRAIAAGKTLDKSPSLLVALFSSFSISISSPVEGDRFRSIFRSAEEEEEEREEMDSNGGVDLADIPSVDLTTELLRRMKCASKPDKRLILIGIYIPPIRTDFLWF